MAARVSRVGELGGLVIVDKDSGLTSHDVVARSRKLLQTKKVGHAGTLDPMATGVLVLGVERATKLLGQLLLTTKAYTATIRLGQATNTDDAEGEVTETTPALHVTDDEIAAGVAALTGDIEQVPATVSAIKVDGERAYARVRAGEEVQLAARPVTVSRFDILARRDVADGEFVDLDVTVECTSGTYIRALARDLGAALGVGGHLTALRRTRVGPFTLEHARTLEELATAADAEQPCSASTSTPLSVPPSRSATSTNRRPPTCAPAAGSNLSVSRASTPPSTHGAGPSRSWRRAANARDR